ncbi:dihydroxyacetone kinase subunit L [Agromyces luteolus]|uniref:Dihydroxyacetone kinase subunit L n=1 Tax=Agromyces luteolus TaxID=88373 RepID=A0A7C9LUN8_9MICO|nr:dihydroxyacetone kinase subunit DhaL [Agromyces luteolus]MUN06239.1 dihydroxyacetone kinase subunit L [Agromyces luteolus]GLK26731.1 dihydroxyacetone kinase subunit L [Agromyces luteolus]
MAGSDDGRVTVDDIVAWMLRFDERIAAEAGRLTALDSAIGDADHGTNIARGTGAVRKRLADDPPDDAGALLKSSGMAIVSTVGGASGSLYGTLFLEMARSVGPTPELDTAELADAFRAGVAGVVARGRAEPGDKTMVDALQPAADALSAAAAGGRPIVESLREAAAAAALGRDATIPLVARKGRASYLGERGADHLDPGATSAAILVQALADARSERVG